MDRLRSKVQSEGYIQTCGYPSPPISEHSDTPGAQGLSNLDDEHNNFIFPCDVFISTLQKQYFERSIRAVRSRHISLGRPRSGSRQYRQTEKIQQTREPVGSDIQRPLHSHSKSGRFTDQFEKRPQISHSLTSKESSLLARPKDMDPQEPPRKVEAHVPSACINCKKAHLKCEMTRPCQRCRAVGKEASCIDVQHKKRGRPRLRGGSSSDSRSGELASDRRQALRDEADPALSAVGYEEGSGSKDGSEPPNIGDRVVTPGRGDLSPLGQSTVFMTMDFIIAKPSQHLIDVLQPPSKVTGCHLAETVIQGDQDKIRRLQEALQQERRAREPSYLPPIYKANEFEAVQSVDNVHNLEAIHGSRQFTENLTFRSDKDQHREFTVQLRLARIRMSVLFVLMTINPRTSWSEPVSPIGPHESHIQRRRDGRTEIGQAVSPASFGAGFPQGQPYLQFQGPTSQSITGQRYAPVQQQHLTTSSSHGIIRPSSSDPRHLGQGTANFVRSGPYDPNSEHLRSVNIGERRTLSSASDADGTMDPVTRQRRSGTDARTGGAEGDEGSQANPGERKPLSISDMIE